MQHCSNPLKSHFSNKKSFSISSLLIVKLLIFLVFFSCNAENKPEGGLFWKITGNGLKEPSYLLGTNHGMSGDFLDSIPRFFEILDSVKQLAVERDISNLFTEDSVKKLQRFLPDGTTYRDLLDDDEIAMLDSVLSKYSPLNSEKMNLSPGRLLYMLNMNMIRKESRQWAKENPFLLINFHKSIESRLLKIAKFRSYLIVELDSEEKLEQLGLEDMSILFFSDNLQDQAKEVVGFIKESQKDTFRMYAVRKAMEAYYLQDLKQMEKWSTHPAVLKDKRDKEIYNTMVVVRNIFWMDKILTSINKEPTLIAVGAAHLPGEKGVINLLREEGYAVQPVEK